MNCLIRLENVRFTLPNLSLSLPLSLSHAIDGFQVWGNPKTRNPESGIRNHRSLFYQYRCTESKNYPKHS